MKPTIYYERKNAVMEAKEALNLTGNISSNYKFSERGAQMKQNRCIP